MATVALLAIPGTGEAQINYLEVQSAPEPSHLVDIVVEAGTYTPSFYRGRAEPVPGGPLKLIAIVRDSGTLDNKSLLYYWNVDGQPINAGKPSSESIELRAPNKNEFLVRLEVTGENGTLVAERSEIIGLSKPFVVFYEVNPLRGLSRIAVGDTLLVTAEEATIEVSPYFLDTISGPAYLDWSVNGTPVASGSDNPYQLVLSRSGLSSIPITISFYAASRETIGLTAEGQLKATQGL